MATTLTCGRTSGVETNNLVKITSTEQPTCITFHYGDGSSTVISGDDGVDGLTGLLILKSRLDRWASHTTLGLS